MKINFLDESSHLVLVLAPHTDDGEFGCGGAISRLIAQGNRVIYVAFSAAEKSVPEGLPTDTLRHEVVAATKALGISPEDCHCLNFEVREFQAYRQDILEEMVKLNRLYAPEVIFMPSQFDTHQDHAVISAEGFRAFKKSTVLGYEVPWNNLRFNNNCFIKLLAEDVDKKIAALSCYESQRGKDYATPEFVRALAHTRGVQVGVQYAECFEAIRLVI